MSVGDVAVKDASVDGVVLDVNVLIHNPNAVGAFADELHATALINDKKAATIDKRGRVTLPAHDGAHVHLPVAIRYADVKAVVDAGAGHDRWPYQVKGEVVLAPVDNVAVRLPFAKTGELIAPRLPVLTVKNARVTRVSASDVVVAADVIVENENMFALPGATLTGSAKIGSATSPVNVTIPAVRARTTQVVKLEQSFALARLGQAALDVAAGRAVPVAVDVAATFGQTKKTLQTTFQVHR